MEQEMIYFEENLQLPKPLGELYFKISSQEIATKKKSIPLSEVTGFAYGDVLTKMGPINGARTFTLNVFAFGKKPLNFQFNRHLLPDQNANITEAIVSSLWKVFGTPKLNEIIGKLKNGEQHQLDIKNGIILHPKGVGFRDRSIFSNKVKLIEWANIEAPVNRGTVWIQDKSRKRVNYQYELIKQENIYLLLQLLKWKSTQHPTVKNLSTMQ